MSTYLGHIIPIWSVRTACINFPRDTDTAQPQSNQLGRRIPEDMEQTAQPKNGYAESCKDEHNTDCYSQMRYDPLSQPTWAALSPREVASLSRLERPQRTITQSSTSRIAQLYQDGSALDLQTTDLQYDARDVPADDVKPTIIATYRSVSVQTEPLEPLDDVSTLNPPLQDPPLPAPTPVSSDDRTYEYCGRWMAAESRVQQLESLLLDVGIMPPSSPHLKTLLAMVHHSDVVHDSKRRRIE
ncbi:hypothetical protein OBBRIDRAFT_807337 [Obba rivulosa]|uniref:Uncharacterized protein n=1 Tax=Obba rivulosa TaxID=1052685 RepID=A0A8E2AK43_9APHY|nr:hypothetical protein OBBRIDRAFT_807337 [Obba rivulosa]